jgi:Flp pilus assembly protein TadG
MNRKRQSRRQGVEIVEMAMVLPVMVMLVLGIIEFGRAFQMAQLLTSAAREGARLGMLYNVVKQQDIANGITSANQKVESDIKNFLRAAGVNTNRLEVLITTPDGDDEEDTVDLDNYATMQEEYFKVTVRAPFDDIAVMPPIFMKDSMLSGEITVRHE